MKQRSMAAVRRVHSMAAAELDGVGDGLQISNVEAKMAIDTSGREW